MKISFIGAGKLGLPLASILAKNNEILLIDKNKNLINTLIEKKYHFNEKDLNQLLNNNYSNFIDFTSSYEHIFSKTTHTIILVNTQLGSDGYSDELVLDVVNELCTFYKEDIKKRHHFILSSTVLPGTINKLINVIEESTEKKYLEDFDFSYVPDFVKLGSVINDFKNPEFFLIGTKTNNAFEEVLQIWENVHENNTPIKKLSLEETEIAKVSLNAYIVNKISFANFLQLICDNLDIDAKNITDVIGLDSRIGNKFFSPGAPYGGTCFPRDALAFEKFANDHNYKALNMEFSKSVNLSVLENLYKQLEKFNKVSIFGVSFKQDTDVLVGSPSIDLIRLLIKNNKKVGYFDYIVKDLGVEGLDSVVSHDDPQITIDKSEAIVLMHNDKRFQNLNFNDVKVFDPWRVLNP